MTRSILRFATWRISPVADAEITFQMECIKCAVLLGSTDSRTRSPSSENFGDVQDWALRHSGRNPEHTAFREHIQRLWTTEMDRAAGAGGGRL